MKEIQLSTKGTLYNDISELSETEKRVMLQAIEARKSAYAPYSEFRVGAAILLENDEIITGNNQENAAYPSGMCAERVAIWRAATTYPNVAIKQICISASSKNYKVNRPVGPCGACRQSLLEYEIKQKSTFEMLFMGEVGQIVKVPSLVSLLPFSFDSSFL